MFLILKNYNLENKIIEPFFAFLLFFAHSGIKKNLYINKEEQEEAERLLSVYNFYKYEFLFLNDVHCFITIKGYDWYMSNISSLSSDGRKIYPYYKVRDFLYDIERIGNACAFIIRDVAGNKIVANNISKMSVILKYGVPVDVFDLLQVSGIGTVRAMKLFLLNITNLEELVKRIKNKDEEVFKILPEKVINNILKTYKNKELIHDKKNYTGIENYG